MKKLFSVFWLCALLIVSFPNTNANAATNMGDAYDNAEIGDEIQLIPAQSINTTATTSKTNRYPVSGFMDIGSFSNIYCNSATSISHSYSGYYATITYDLKDESGTVLQSFVYNANYDASNQAITRINIITKDIETDKQVYLECRWNTGSSGGYAYKSEIGAVYGIKGARYTLSYNANGGTGGPSSIKVTSGYSTTISSVKPTRTGYDFLGWSTSENSTVAEFVGGDTLEITENTTLYAVWKSQKPYFAGFNGDGNLTTVI